MSQAVALPFSVQPMVAVVVERAVVVRVVGLAQDPDRVFFSAPLDRERAETVLIDHISGAADLNFIHK